MNPVRNPFAPGAGSQPPELAGRKLIIDDADISIQRVMRGRYGRPQMILGLRGVGKTVLLNKIQEIAESHGHFTSLVEAQDQRALSDMLVPKMNQILRRLSGSERAKEYVANAFRALCSFVSRLKINFQGIDIEFEAERGVADSGNLELDLPELFERIGIAAREAGKAWTLLIDEVQYLQTSDLSALIVAIHRISQKNLPVLFFGAGLPQTAALSGDAKSYAERLFSYPKVDALEEGDAMDAIRTPLHRENVQIENEALHEIVKNTHGYPYFLQEWGSHAWAIAENNLVTLQDVKQATKAAIQSLDNGFFKVRFDRLTPKEREYLQAMSRLGKGPYRSSDVANALKKDTQSLGPCRAQIISKGMIYSPAYGDIDFTVPLFDEYLRRNFPEK